MIGFYDYTVWLTYASLLSAGTGIVVALSGLGHPYMGMFFLLFSGFCDAFDGMVARTKKDRSRMQCNYGIQIDSLADVVAFGVLPACIGVAMMRRSEIAPYIFRETGPIKVTALGFVMHVILMLFMLAALIRLAYFNVTEEQRQETEGTKARKEYTGLPVTSSALIFPTVMLIDYLCTGLDLTLVYFSVLVITGLAFLLKFKVKKPSKRGVLVMVGIGAVEFLILLLGELLTK